MVYKLILILTIYLVVITSSLQTDDNSTKSLTTAALNSTLSVNQSLPIGTTVYLDEYDPMVDETEFNESVTNSQKSSSKRVESSQNTRTTESTKATVVTPQVSILKQAIQSSASIPSVKSNLMIFSFILILILKVFIH